MHGRAVSAFLCVALATPLCAQSQGAVPADLLPRFQAAVKETLRRLPDYTCRETIARSRRAPPRSRFEPLDTIRLQVGLIGGRERYSWPDAARFDDRELRDLIGRGIIGSGNFAAHVQHVFLYAATRFTPRGAVVFRDRPASVFDYEVPVEYSRYKLRVPPEEAEVAVHGSFWVDLETLDLLRLEVHADEIPPELGMSRVSEIIGYARIPIGDSDFLLATSAELTMAALNGEEYRNQITFGECRQFRTDSSIRFDVDSTAPPSTVSRRSGREALPPSLRVDLTLDSDIDPEKAAIGDSIRAIVARPIRDGTQAFVPEGSIVHGRLVRLERSSQPFEHYVVGLEFHTLETAGARLDFFATMEDAGPAPGLLRQAKRLDPVFTRKRTARLDILVRERRHGEGVLHWDAKHPLIRRGLKMHWLTVEPEKLASRAP